jgi:hypothetical protein
MPRPVQVATGASSKRGIFKPEHQACEPIDDKPRYFYLNPDQAPNGVWAGSQQYVDFTLTQELGVLNSLNLRFDLKFSGADTAGTTKTNGVYDWMPSLPPTPYWTSRVELYLGSDLVSTTYADSIWHETLAFLTEQNAHDVADTYNTNLLDLSPRNILDPDTYNGGAPAAGLIPSGDITSVDKGGLTQTSSGYWYMSVDATPLKQMKPFIRGFNSRFRVRIYFPPSVVAQYALKANGTANTAVAPAPSNATAATFYTAVQPEIASLVLIAEEAQTDAASLMRLEAAHKSGVIDYSAIISERLQDSPPSYVPKTNTTTFLRAFRNKSAGLVVYFTAQSASNDRLTQRYAFSTLQLLDSRGNKITEILDNDALTSFIFPAQINSSFPNSANADIRTIVLLPFCSNFQDVVQKACARGGLAMTSLEQLVVVPDNGVAGVRNSNGEMSMVGSNTMLTVVAYSYAHITCVAGKHNIRFETSVV